MRSHASGKKSRRNCWILKFSIQQEEQNLPVYRSVFNDDLYSIFATLTVKIYMKSKRNRAHVTADRKTSLSRDGTRNVITTSGLISKPTAAKSQRGLQVDLVAQEWNAEMKWWLWCCSCRSIVDYAHLGCFSCFFNQCLVQNAEFFPNDFFWCDFNYIVL